MDVTQVLLAAQSADHATRTEAEKVLLNAQETNFAAYLTTLADHLAGEDHNADSRRLAGLIMKNALYSKSEQEQAVVAQRWKSSVDNESKTRVRQALLNTIRSSASEARRAAAQVIAKIASIDLPENHWGNLVDVLLQSVLSDTSSDFLREASLETLGYICEEEGFRMLPDEVLVLHSNRILSAVIHGINYMGSPNNGTRESAAVVRLIAMRALINVLEFSRTQFESVDARNVIMTAICKAAKSEDERLRSASFEGLVRIGENYYDTLPDYIRSLYELTEEAIRNDKDSVALQAIEFWSTIAEEEISLLEEAEASREMGIQVTRTSKNFVATALPYLIRSIFESLKKQEGEPLDDESPWNCATAAGACLELLSQAAPQQILSLVMPFVRENINDVANWRAREAAILAFGSVLEGPPLTEIQSLVREAVPIFIQTLKSDPHIAVRDTTAWTLARAVLVDQETTAKNLNALVDCLRSTLSNADNPVLAAHVCFAIHNVAECFSDEADNATGTLGEHVEVLLRAVLTAADRDDASEGHLRLNAYEALNVIFRSVPLESVTFVISCVPLLLEKLEKTLHKSLQTLNREDANELLESQSLLCGSLQSATQRLTMQQLAPFADRMMQAYLRLFSIGGDDRTVHEDALYAVGAIADKAGKDFTRYMQHFMPVLSAALSTNALRADEKHTIVGIGVTVVGDIARGLGIELMQCADQIVSLLLEALKSPVLNRPMKPPILSCLGDIAIAVKGHFERYLKMVMECMKAAAHSSVSMTVDPDDYDTIDFVIALRESIFEAYVGIVNGLRDDNKQELLQPHVEWLIAFSEIVDREIQSAPAGAESLTKALASVLGDLVDAMPELKADLRQRQWVSGLLSRGSAAKDERIREVAKWALHSIYQD